MTSGGRTAAGGSSSSSDSSLCPSIATRLPCVESHTVPFCGRPCGRLCVPSPITPDALVDEPASLAVASRRRRMRSAGVVTSSPSSSSSTSSSSSSALRFLLASRAATVAAFCDHLHHSRAADGRRRVAELDHLRRLLKVRRRSIDGRCLRLRLHLRRFLLSSGASSSSASSSSAAAAVTAAASPSCSSSSSSTSSSVSLPQRRRRRRRRGGRRRGRQRRRRRRHAPAQAPCLSLYFAYAVAASTAVSNKPSRRSFPCTRASRGTCPPLRGSARTGSRSSSFRSVELQHRPIIEAHLVDQVGLGDADSSSGGARARPMAWFLIVGLIEDDGQLDAAATRLVAEAHVADGLLTAVRAARAAPPSAHAQCDSAQIGVAEREVVGEVAQAARARRADPGPRSRGCRIFLRSLRLRRRRAAHRRALRGAGPPPAASRPPRLRLARAGCVGGRWRAAGFRAADTPCTHTAIETLEIGRKIAGVRRLPRRRAGARARGIARR